MKIEIWSDYVCPYCYIGKRRMEQALKNTGLEKVSEMKLKAYQLDPNAPEVSNESIYENLATKYSLSIEEAKKMTENLTEEARVLGLEYNFEVMTTANTRNAHRLAKWAEVQRKEDEFSEKVLQAYFTQGRKIGQEDVLLEIAESIGLSWNDAKAVLSTGDFEAEVDEDIRKARQIGIQGVPFFVVNNKYAISGAQPADVLEEALRQIAEEEGIKPALQQLGKKNTEYCTGDSCDM